MANKELLITLGLDSSSYSQNVRKAKDLNKELDSSFELLSSSSEKFEDSLKGLGKKQDYLSDKIKIANGLTEVYSKKLKEVEAELKNATNNSHIYGKAMEEIQKKMAGVEKGSDAWKVLNAELTKNKQLFDKANKAVTANSKLMLTLQNEYNKVQTSVQELGREYTLTGEKMKAMGADANLDILVSDLKKADNQFETLKSGVVGFDKTLAGLSSSQTHYTNKLKETNVLLSAYDREIDKSNKSIASYGKKLDEVSKELEEWEALLKGLKKSEPDYDQYRKEVEKLRKEYSEINKVVEFHSDRVEKMGKEYANTKTKISATEKEIIQVNRSVTELNRKKIFDGFDDNIERLNGQIKVLDSQFRVVESSLKNFGKTKQDVATKSEHFKEKIILLKDQLKTYNSALDKSGKHLTELREEQDLTGQSVNALKLKMLSMDKNSPKYQEALQALARLELAYEEVTKDVRTFQTQNNTLQQNVNRTTAEINEMARATNRLSQDFASNSFRNLGSNMTKIGNGIKGVGSSLLGVSMVIGAVETAMIRTGVEFDNSMSKVRAVTGATQEDFAKLEESARRLGKETIFSASESADALVYLGLAGYTAQQSIDSLPHILNLAQAGAMDLATASDLATDSIASLGYIGEDAVAKMPDYLDKIAVTAMESNSSIEQMMQSYIKVGGQLDTMNISLDTSASMLGVLANRGIKAEYAGNSLNSILINMTKRGGESAKAMDELGISMFDSQGNIRNVEEVMVDLSKALSGLSQQDQIQLINMIGGKTQAKTLQKLMQGMIDDTGNLSSEYLNLKNQIEKAPDMGALEEMSRIMTDNLGGDIKLLTSQIEDSFLDIFKSVEPELRAFVQKLTKGIEALTEKFLSLDKNTQMFILKMASLTVVLAPALMIIGSVASGFGAIFSAIGWVIGIFPSFNNEVEGAGGQVTGLSKKMQGLVDDIPKMITAIKGYGTSVGTFFTGLTTSVGGWLTGLGATITGSALWTTLSGVFASIGTAIATGFGAVFSVAGAKVIAVCLAIAGALYLLYKGIKYLWENWDSICTNMKNAWSNSMEWIGKKIDWIKEKLSEFGDRMKLVFDKTVQMVKDLPQTIKKAFGKVVDKLIQIVGTLVGTILAGFVVAGKQLFDIVKGWGGIFEGAFKIIKGIFTLNLNSIKDGIKQIFSSIGKMIKNSIKNAWAFISGALENLASIFGIKLEGVTKAIETWCSTTWANFKTWLFDMWTSFSTWFSETLAKLPDWLAGIWLVFAVWCAKLWTDFKTWLSEIKTNLTTWASETWQGFKTWLYNLWTSFVTWCSEMWTKLTTFLVEFANDPLKYLKIFAENIKTGLNTAWTNFKTWCTDMKTSLITWFNDWIAETKRKLSEWAKKFEESVIEIVTYFKELPKKLYNIGVEMISNLWKGFKSKMSDFGNWVSSSMGNILDKLNPFSSTTIDAEVNYAEGEIPNPMMRNVPYQLSIGRKGFGGIDSMFDKIFKQAFSLDNYKTNGGFYNANSMSSPKDTVAQTNASLLEALIQQNQILMQLLTNNTIEVGVNVDGRTIAKASAKYMQREMNTLTKRSARLGGAGY